MPPSRSWTRILEQLDFAFQPIVNVHTGACYAYEALLRGVEDVGFARIHDLFDAAYTDLQLHWVDLRLREMALSKFVQIGHHRQTKIFYNLDCRVMEMPNYVQGQTSKILAAHGLSEAAICFEISERHDIALDSQVAIALDQYRDQGFKIALDDYGCGYSGLQRLYHSEPHFIKIDRFFIEGIATDARKRLFVSSAIDMARSLGISVICEGVETLEELRVCREAGCDLAQGFLVQRPTTDLRMLRSAYPQVLDALPDRRSSAERVAPVATRMEMLETIHVTSAMSAVLEKFRSSKDATFWVVTDERSEPVGLLCERSIRSYIFSPYGWALLAGGEPEALEPYVTKCPIAEIHTPLERLADMFAFGDAGEEGVIITDNGVYVGFMRASEILKAMHERDVALARDQNPLTGLPGNNRIGDFIREALVDQGCGYGFVYFDFDGFKGFNDAYGFREGDQAIQLFADILKAHSRSGGFFVGHVGGDDFFAGIKLPSRGFDNLVTSIADIMEQFRLEAGSLRSANDEAGCRHPFASNRTVRDQPPLDISAAVVHVPGGRSGVSPDGLAALIATLKSSAKRSPTHIATLEYDGAASAEFPDMRQHSRHAPRGVVLEPRFLDTP
jgi:diguanylate cyclase (GGDEF)-like protein